MRSGELGVLLVTNIIVTIVRILFNPFPFVMAELADGSDERPIRALFVDAAMPVGTQFVIARYEEPTEWLR